MPPRRARDAHEARVEALREEARSGLASSDVRRTLIKEQLRPPPRPIPTPPAKPRQHTTLSSVPSSSAPHVSVHAEAAGSAEDSLPAAWLQGAFSLDDTPSAPTAQALTSSTRNYQSAQQAYEALCAVADSVDYDVPYEEGLRSVETRDGDTGVATSWITRRASAPPLGSSATPLPRHRATSATASASSPKHALTDAAHSLYTPSPSAHGVANASAPPSRASLYSTPSTAVPSERSRRSSRGATTLSGRPSGQLPAATVGTAVLRSTAADFATALRRRVQAQRGESSSSSRGRLGALAHSSVNDVWPEHAGDEGGAATWRTSVTAAVALAACPSCETLFQRALDATALCPQCGKTVSVKAATSLEGTPQQQRWLLPPPPTPTLPSPPQQHEQRSPPPPAPFTSAGEGCGTDSIGFPSEDGEDSFTALVARIRASKHAAVAVTSKSAATTCPSSMGGRQSVAAGDGRSNPASVPPSQPVAVSAVAVVDPMVARLRTALSRPYYFELARSAQRSSLPPSSS